MSSTKADRQMARDAGRRACNDRQPVDSCPYPDGSDERESWLVGYRQADTGK